MSETTGPTAGERVLAKIIMADGIASPTATEAARRILASGWLDVVRRKAGDERGERIAQSIDRRRFHVGDCVCVVCAAYRHAASIARAYVADRSESNVRDGCFAPPTAEELAAMPRCATCGGIYPLECPPHITSPARGDAS